MSKNKKNIVSENKKVKYDIFQRGYSPEANTIDPNDPPKGGSGVPKKENNTENKKDKK